MTCYVVDDEHHAIQVLARYIENTPALQLVGTEENPLQALSAITSGAMAPDITFLDVDMPQLSGIDLAGLISRHTTVIFTTAYPDYALQAFEKDAVDYLLKPISYERFLRAITKAGETLQAKQKEQPTDNISGYFYIKSDVKGKVVRIDLADICYVEAQQNYVRIQIENGVHTTYLTIKEVEEYLPSEFFCRVHKSFIVNKSKVRAVEGNQILLSSEHTVSLGASYRTAFLEMINVKLLQSRRGH